MSVRLPITPGQKRHRQVLMGRYQALSQILEGAALDTVDDGYVAFRKEEEASVDGVEQILDRFEFFLTFHEQKAREAREAADAMRRDVPDLMEGQGW